MRYRYRNPIRRAFGGLYSILWLMIIILFFVTHSWIWFLIGALLSAILGVVIRLLTAGIIGAGIFGAASMMSNQQQQQPPYQPYQPPYQPYQPPYQPYQQGYQPPPQQPPAYQEGSQQYPYQPPQQPPQYEQPQAQYPQELPPQQ